MRSYFLLSFYMGNALDDYINAITSTMSSRWALNECQRVRLRWLIRRIGPRLGHVQRSLVTGTVQVVSRCQPWVGIGNSFWQRSALPNSRGRCNAPRGRKNGNVSSHKSFPDANRGVASGNRFGNDRRCQIPGGVATPPGVLQRPFLLATSIDF